MCDLKQIVEDLMHGEAQRLVPTVRKTRDEMPELPPQPIAPTPINPKNAG